MPEPEPEPEPRSWHRDTLNWVIVGASAAVLALLVALCCQLRGAPGACTPPEDGRGVLGTALDLVAYRCRHRALYGLALVFALALEVLRGCLAPRLWQTRRDALKTPRGTAARRRFLGRTAGYLFINFSLYIISVLFLVARNLGVLVAMLVGSVAGSVISAYMMEADRFTPYATLATPDEDAEYEDRSCAG